MKPINFLDFELARSWYTLLAGQGAFTIRGDGRNALYAKIGAMRPDAESMSFFDLSEFLGKQLSNPLVKQDLLLRLGCLAPKGYTDIEINEAGKVNLRKARATAKQLDESASVNRASGEVGAGQRGFGNLAESAAGGAEIQISVRGCGEFCGPDQSSGEPAEFLRGFRSQRRRAMF